MRVKIKATVVDDNGMEQEIEVEIPITGSTTGIHVGEGKTRLYLDFGGYEVDADFTPQPGFKR